MSANAARAAAAALLVVAVATLAGCTAGATVTAGKSSVNVYVSMPLAGPGADSGRDVVDGARLALAEAGGKVGGLAVRGVYLDDTEGSGRQARWSAAQAGQNARRATQDTAAIAYIGEFDSGATRTSEPITNEAHLLQVSPASTAVDLTRPFLGSQELPDVELNSNERTFGRVIPDDQAQAEAAAKLTQSLGIKRVEITGTGAYARVVGDAYRSALGRVQVVRRGADGDLYAGLGPSVLPGVGGAPAGPRPRFTRIATDAVLPPWSPPPARWRYDEVTASAQDPSQLPSTGQRFLARFRNRFGRSAGPYAAYGYEAMAVVLDSIRRAGEQGDNRQAVIDQFFATADRRSILGSYSVDSVGDSTLNRVGAYRSVGGRLVPRAGAIPVR